MQGNRGVGFMQMCVPTCLRFLLFGAGGVESEALSQKIKWQRPSRQFAPLRSALPKLTLASILSGGWPVGGVVVGGRWVVVGCRWVVVGVSHIVAACSSVA